MKTKICSKCNKEQDIIEFYRNKRTKDGLYCWCKKCCRLYYQNHKKQWREYYLKYKTKYPVKFWCQKTIDNHKRKEFKVLFTFEELLPIAQQTTYCPICNTKLDWKYGTGLHNNSPTLDRVNNEKVLRLRFNPNVLIICFNCNATKRNRTMREFIKYCKMVVEKF